MKCHAEVLQTAVPWCSLWLTSTCKYFKSSNFRAEKKKQKLCVVPNICLAEIHLFSHANRLSQPCAVIALTVAHTTSLYWTALFATLVHWAIWMSAGICFELFGTFRRKIFFIVSSASLTEYSIVLFSVKSHFNLITCIHEVFDSVWSVKSAHVSFCL